MKRLVFIAALLAAFLLVQVRFYAFTPVIVDHDDIALFDIIPSEYLTAARALVFMTVDRSVGENIDNTLRLCLPVTFASAPAACKIYVNSVDHTYDSPPSSVQWTGTYPIPNWSYYGFPNTGIGTELVCGISSVDAWQLKLQCIINWVAANPTAVNVVSYQNSYLEVENTDDIASPTVGYFVRNQAARADIADYEATWTANPSLYFINFTSSLARGIGSVNSQTFNTNMRNYIATANYPSNGRYLIDVADILSHAPANGAPCYDDRDGVAYGAENYPDDGLNIPAICQHYTSEIDGGHLGSPASGAIQVAKAFWVMMAQVAGWDPTAGVVNNPLISRIRVIP